MSVFQQISVYSPLLPLTCFLLFCLKNSKIELKVVFVYIILSIAVDIFTTSSKWGIHYIYTIQAIFTIVEYFSVSLFIYLSFENSVFKKIILFTSLIFICYFIVNVIRSDRTKFDSMSSSLEAILIIGYCIMYMFEQINKSQISFIYSSPHFWIVMAFFIYVTSTFFLFITTSSFSSTEKNQYWIINHISNIITNIFLSIGFIMNKNTHELNPSEDQTELGRY